MYLASKNTAASMDIVIKAVQIRTNVLLTQSALMVSVYWFAGQMKNVWDTRNVI